MYWGVVLGLLVGFYVNMQVRTLYYLCENSYNDPGPVGLRELSLCDFEHISSGWPFNHLRSLGEDPQQMSILEARTKIYNLLFWTSVALMVLSLIKYLKQKRN
jgi:hypothetical protein